MQITKNCEKTLPNKLLKSHGYTAVSRQFIIVGYKREYIIVNQIVDDRMITSREQKYKIVTGQFQWIPNSTTYFYFYHKSHK